MNQDPPTQSARIVGDSGPSCDERLSLSVKRAALAPGLLPCDSPHSKRKHISFRLDRHQDGRRAPPRELPLIRQGYIFRGVVWHHTILYRRFVMMLGQFRPSWTSGYLQLIVIDPQRSQKYIVFKTTTILSRYFRMGDVHRPENFRLSGLPRRRLASYYFISPLRHDARTISAFVDVWLSPTHRD
jgi:hypothetical protein